MSAWPCHLSAWGHPNATSTCLVCGGDVYWHPPEVLRGADDAGEFDFQKAPRNFLVILGVLALLSVMAFFLHDQEALEPIPLPTAPVWLKEDG